MKALSVNQCIEWCKARGIELDDREQPQEPDEAYERLRCEIPKNIERLTWFCRFVESKLQPWQNCLLWMSAWGIWESSENWHLYYRLRQGYGDERLMEDAPGHLFQDFESNDLVSFLQVGLISGWDMHLLPSPSYARAFVSHDGWIEFALKDKAELKAIEAELGSE